jgi:hypothetical protein
MIGLLPWLLPVFLFAVWWLWVVTCSAHVLAEDIRRSTPQCSRRGVSILPGFPLFPLLFWAATVFVDRWFQPWGTILVGGFHLVFALFLLASVVRDVAFCRSQQPHD